MAGEDKLREYLKRVTTDLTIARRRLAEAEAREQEPIAVIGMSCRFPDADDVDAYWDLLREGRAARISDPPPGRFDHDPRAGDNDLYTPRQGAFLPDVAGFDAEFFGFPPREALRMDPQQRLLLELAWETMEDAGTPAATLSGTRTGVLLGFSDSFQYGQLAAERQGTGIYADPYMGQGSLASVVAGRIAYHFDLRGPAFSLDTACSSTLVAVHQATRALRTGECDFALAGGGFLALHPFLYIYSSATSLLSPTDRCHTFDASADGYLMGEGGGMVMLARLSDALRDGHRIRAVIRGSAVNQDGRSNGLTAPNRDAQVEVIRRALAAAGTTPGEVDYLEAHGSGTRLGDEIELGALHEVFAGRPAERALPVGAVKTNIGHTHTAAGIAGLIKTVLVLENRLVPPNLHMTEPAETVASGDAVRPAAGLTPLPDSALAGVSSFGWSGTNAHVVLEAAPAPPAAPTADGEPGTAGRRPELLPLSAASPAALEAQQPRLAAALAAPGTELTDVAHTLQTGRAALAHRRAVIATDPAEAATQLGTPLPGVCRLTRPTIAYLLPGVGDQYRGLGRTLYREEPVFAAAVDECLTITAERCGVDLRPVLESGAPETAPAPGEDASFLGAGGDAADGEDPFDHAETAHPFLFTVEYALARLLAHRGVRPDLLVGYSLGEYVAACLAGVFTLSDALWVVTERARLIEAAPSGRMLAVAAGPEQLDDLGPEVDIAARNGPQMTVLSGAPDAIEAARHRLVRSGVAARVLRSAHPFHSSLLEPAQDKLAEVVASVPRQAPRIPVISNATGRELTAEQATDPRYWAGHLCRPVLFADSVRHCAEREVDAYVELGPGQTLGGLVRQNLTGGARPAVLGTLPAPWPVTGRTPEHTALMETCGRLWEHGVELDWSALRHRPARLVTLPGYPFQRTRYWPERQEPQGSLPATAPAAAGTGDDAGGHCYVPVWRQDLTRLPAGAPPLTGPLVIFSDGAVGSRLADLAEAAGAAVTEVVPGGEPRRNGRRAEIDPADPAHYREVLGAAAGSAEGPVRVVHLWSLLDPAGSVLPSDAELRTAVRHGFDSLMLAVQALDGRTARLLTVSAGAAEITGGDLTAPDRALVHGLGRGVRAEYPGLTWRGVDIEPTPAAAGQLLEELRREPGDPATEPVLTGWRGGRRRLQEFTAITPDNTADAEWNITDNCLITGGTRGLGMILARRLADRGVRRLALVSRTGQADAGDLAELTAAGAEVLLLRADTGDPVALRRALREAAERFGGLEAVVHAAGLPGGGLVQRQTPADAARVMAPKVLAMGPLAELLGPDAPAALRPRLLVLYSSIATVVGGLGEADYCAANSVLDAYGQALAGIRPDTTRVVAVAWGHWQHDNWRNEATGADRIAYRQRYGFTDEAGCALLGRLAGQVHGTVVALGQPLPQAIPELLALNTLDGLLEGVTGELADTAAGSGAGRFPRPPLRTEYTAPRTRLEERIADVWGEYLGIDRIGVHDPFFDLGGNSLVGMAMVSAIERLLDQRIAPAVLFAHPTVAAFGAALSGTEEPAPPTGTTRGERRRARISATQK
jgi:acyl transferase domain-containing protein